MKTVLAIETSTAACSVALLHGGDCFSVFEMQPQKHAIRVLPMVDAVLAQAGIQPEQIDLLAFGEGPGAFTGIRIAAGVVQGLALGWNKPVQGISSLEATAFSGLQNRPDAGEQTWLALLDARMGEVYLQYGRYDKAKALWQADSAQLLDMPHLNAVLDKLLVTQVPVAFGDIDLAYPEVSARFADWTHMLPSAEAVAYLARIKQSTGKALTESVPLPVYLRNQVAETIEQRRAKTV
ncbi:MAG: tRNA (adenosine(37)-N6)-threonylcarbamoyltransferase complex dimerization subunit type 1 TsaB [Gammaproteobacteria bacterium]|nr:tRNA (adenosine(37)-N6)-threonylcarbamoyltransferase complex dimerization subunit type 1 TsaB [Gammaproteobacteria bacterium]